MVQVFTRFGIESTPISSSLALIPVERSSSVADTGVLQSRSSATTRTPSIADQRTQVRAVMATRVTMYIASSWESVSFVLVCTYY